MPETLPPPRRRTLTDAIKDAIGRKNYQWRGGVARPEQLLPDGDWRQFLILAGRGWGKTRSGAEAVREWIESGITEVGIVAPTLDDCRKLQVESPNGLMNIFPPHGKVGTPVFHPSRFELRFEKCGARILMFSDAEFERIRGSNFQKVWIDEIGSFKNAETWDHVNLALRIPPAPQCIITSTPRPSKFLKSIIDAPDTIVVRGRTHDNYSNLDKGFISAIEHRYQGKRLYRQEVLGEYLEEVEGALWSLEMIERSRVKKAPDLVRIVVAVDPSMTATGDEWGVIAVGIAENRHIYVLDDASGRYSPEEGARAVVSTYDRWGADLIVGESNQGGDWLKTMLDNVRRNLPYRKVSARRGKYLRSEPVSQLYEQGIVHHVGVFNALEDQMTTCVPGEKHGEDDRVDGLVHAATELIGTPEPAFGYLTYLKKEKESEKVETPASTPVESAAMTCPRCSGTVGKLCGDQGWRCPACGWQGGNTVKFAPARRTAATDYAAQWRAIGRRS